jgi:choline dehydrogenase-like flavoprotein
MLGYVTMKIKLADPCSGTSCSRINKKLTAWIREEAGPGCGALQGDFSPIGIHRDDIFLGTINAGHPSGMLPLTAKEAESFHNPGMPDNLYVADGTLFPESLGNPPILTIMAMAGRVAKKVTESYA